jgi:aspartyl-tRNA(Asn)/glutamyl-tRNA(Gln) amidotransferase subunit C
VATPGRGRRPFCARIRASRIAAVIDRAEVLHVARLARLSLTEEEVERMATDLSAILDHIEAISQLDLSDVPPTSHVVEVSNALRPDEPRPSLSRDAALASAPVVAADGFEVPSPGA